MPTTWTRDDVRRVAELARLDLTDAEIALFTQQLADILTYAELVQQVDTTGIPPTSHPLATTPAWRDDTPSRSIERSAVLDQAPDASRSTGLFRVPKVL
jgi:aspartyl-tRNA(Asn)/glutamyl-tRNA(Gln) amidotransferase subunit C